MSKWMPRIALGLIAVLAFAACAADEKPAPGTSGNAVPSGSSSSSSSEEASSSGGPTALTVFASEPAPDTFTFDTGGVESLPAGPVLITIQNLGTMAHELRVVKIRDGNFAAFRAAVTADATSAASLADEVAKSPSIDAGKSSTFGAELSTGTYALVCFLPAPDGKLFAQHGMIRQLGVTPA
jgi:hypothetical protein